MFSSDKRIPFYLFISVIIHLLVYFLMRDVWQGYQRDLPEEQKALWVNLKEVTPEELPIADISKPAEEKKPETARAQSLYDQSVKEETVAPAQARRDEPQKGAKPVHAPKQKDYAVKDGADELKKIFKSKTIPGMPEAEAPEGQLGPSDDFLPYYKVGGRTYINAHANMNIRYYVELKRKFRLTFNPGPALRNHLYEISRGKIDVVLGVSVNAEGELADLVVIRSSGIDSYDSESRRTVRSSSPFSGPPEALLDDEGMLHMAWTFVVYL